MDFEDRIMYRDSQLIRMSSMMSLMSKVIISMCILILVMSIYIMTPSIRKILDSKADILRLQAKGYEIIPDIESKISDIDKSLQTLTTKNIENRLSKIEKAIQVGEIKIEDIQSIQNIREDFKVLKTYMFETPEKLIEFRSIQKDYIELKDKFAKTMDKDDIIREIDSLKSLFYYTLAIVGILVSIFAGSWVVAIRNSSKNIKDESSTHEIKKEE